MDPDALLKTIAENPITSGIVASIMAAVVGFFRPIMTALQAALIRRIEQKWPESAGEVIHDDRVRKTAERVRYSTLMPLSQSFIERRIREHKSEPPPAL